jgi:Flp pilus assembly protein TadG
MRDRSGSAAVELALVAPFLLATIMGMMIFGLAMNNYLELSDATRAGARQLALGRNSGSTTPYSSAVTALENDAPNLTASSITITATVNGTACSTDAACVTAFASSSQGESAVMTATYPCSLNVMGVVYANPCTLTATTTEAIE